jgi:hypothetical protein
MVHALKKLILEESLKESKVLVVASKTLGATFPDPPEGWEATSDVYHEAKGLHLANLFLSYKFKHPLFIDEQGVRTKLAFEGTIAEVVLPWEAIIVIRASESSHMWAIPGGVEKPVSEAPEPSNKAYLRLVN